MKNNKTALAILLAAALATGGGIYYANRVYIPAKNAEAAAELRAQREELQAQQDAQAPEYDYQIEEIAAGEISLDGGSADVTGRKSNVTVTTDENGEKWIHRDWGAVDVSKLDKYDEEPDRGSTANMGSGGGELELDEDGVYRGDHPMEPTGGSGNNGGDPSKSDGSGGSGNNGDNGSDDTGNGGNGGPGSGDSGNGNSGSGGSSGDGGGGNTGNGGSGSSGNGGSGNNGNGGSGSNGGNSGSSGGSSSPEWGERRTNPDTGKEEVYVPGFGWQEPTGGKSESVHIGELSGEYYGSFG